jgi:hypothetical protein
VAASAEHVLLRCGLGSAPGDDNPAERVEEVWRLVALADDEQSPLGLLGVVLREHLCVLDRRLRHIVACPQIDICALCTLRVLIHVSAQVHRLLEEDMLLLHRDLVEPAVTCHFLHLLAQRADLSRRTEIERWCLEYVDGINVLWQTALSYRGLIKELGE